MRLHLTVARPDRPSVDLLVEADPGHRVAQFAGQVAGALGTPPGEPLYLDGVELAADLPLGESPIRDGVVLGLGGPAGRRWPHGQGIVEIRVVGGPGAGEIHRLGPGIYSIGSSVRDRIRLADPTLPADAVSLTVSPDGGIVATPRGEVPLVLEAMPVVEPTAWPAGYLLGLGRVLLEPAVPDFPDAALHPSADGAGLDYNRPPRLDPPESKTTFALPNEPQPAERRPLPWVMATVPLVGALVIAVLLKNSMFLAFALLSPVSVTANYFVERRHGRASYGRTVDEYNRRRAVIEAAAEDALTAVQAQRRSACPDPAAVALLATGPRHRLWERRRRDPDCGLLRLGTGTLPSGVVLTDPSVEEHERLEPLAMHEVPVTVSLSEYGVVGLAGHPEQVRALACWAVAQSAVLHSPSDLEICVLTDPEAARTWDWMRWVPHARPRGGQQALALVGCSTPTVGARISELLTQLTERQSALRAAGSGARLDAPDVLVVLDGSRRLRALPGMPQLLAEGPAVGIRLLCLDSEARLLPEECRAVAVVDQQGVLTLRQSERSTNEGIRPDLVNPEWCERVGRGLAALRDVSRDDDSALPDSARLLEVLDLDPPTSEQIAAIWSSGGSTTAAVVGVSVDGPFSLDLRRDGPHGLVAGTTGSGKSELLQTIVASLAVANRPDAMNFVLVDYKGGSAFGECARLPHTVGMVTDLDAHLVRRALESLSAELRTREHTFAAAGATDLESYLDRRRRETAPAPMPRLLIVIDEFASLARELPDFVSGLVNIAQRGRSLGIHLVLATQRPSGVVSPEIRANTNLRIALRVTDTTESADVIDAPDAARIAKANPGRAFLRLGHSALLPFQTARIGGRRPGSMEAGSNLPPWVQVLGGTEIGAPIPGRPVALSREANPVTDLGLLVEAIRAASADTGVATQRSPWLPALPSAVALDDLARPDEAGDLLRAAPFALVDLPAIQARETECVDLSKFGHLFVSGAARSGRSQALRTIAGSLARENAAADVHLFGIDCGNGALLPLAELPHCGAVVRVTETERVERLLAKFAAVVQERMTALGVAGFADIGEQRAAMPAAERMAHLVLLLDRWEGFVATFGERNGGVLIDQVMRLLREGAGLGVHLVVAGDHTLLGGRMGALTEHKIVLRMVDKGDFGVIGINSRTVPDELPPGRGYRAPGGAQVQIALLDSDPTGAAQIRALGEIAADARDRDRDVPDALRPFGVDVLPSRISFEAAWRLRPPGTGPRWVLAGVGGDRLVGYGPDLAAGAAAFLVGGPPGSGRSTALHSLAASALAVGGRVLLVLPRPSPLLLLAEAPGVVGVVEGTDLTPSLLAKHCAEQAPLLVVLDDAELLRDVAAGEELAQIVRRAGGPAALVAAGDPESVGTGFSGWQVEARKARRGLLLSPQNVTDADLIGTRVPRALIGGPVEPGRGLLHLGDGKLRVVQVPQP